MHSLINEADNVLQCADKLGVSMFIRQAPEFAEDHSDDTVIIVLRGKNAVALGAKPLRATAELVEDSIRYLELSNSLLDTAQAADRLAETS